ncbi:hypothetical protein C1646_769313 [Rhizophagus diaphanus]|nr:hypothetical protein C1646_769313 [Rhizophagus diaphanus] [Rhizophagus sp. MUCL 43196]
MRHNEDYYDSDEDDDDLLPGLLAVTASYDRPKAIRYIQHNRSRIEKLLRVSLSSVLNDLSPDSPDLDDSATSFPDLHPISLDVLLNQHDLCSDPDELEVNTYDILQTILALDEAPIYAPDIFTLGSLIYIKEKFFPHLPSDPITASVDVPSLYADNPLSDSSQQLKRFGKRKRNRNRKRNRKRKRNRNKKKNKQKPPASNEDSRFLRSHGVPFVSDPPPAGMARAIWDCKHSELFASLFSHPLDRYTYDPLMEPSVYDAYDFPPPANDDNYCRNPFNTDQPARFQASIGCSASDFLDPFIDADDYIGFNHDISYEISYPDGSEGVYYKPYNMSASDWSRYVEKLKIDALNYPLYDSIDIEEDVSCSASDFLDPFIDADDYIGFNHDISYEISYPDGRASVYYKPYNMSASDWSRYVEKLEIDALNYPLYDSIDIEEDVSHPTFLVANYDCHTFTSDSDDEPYDSDDDPYFSPDFNFCRGSLLLFFHRRLKISLSLWRRPLNGLT